MEAPTEGVESSQSVGQPGTGPPCLSNYLGVSDSPHNHTTSGNSQQVDGEQGRTTHIRQETQGDFWAYSAFLFPPLGFRQGIFSQVKVLETFPCWHPLPSTNSSKITRGRFPRLSLHSCLALSLEIPKYLIHLLLWWSLYKLSFFKNERSTETHRVCYMLPTL